MKDIPLLLNREFEKTFGLGVVPHLYFAPGRINLIGEHIDYNGGKVLPCNIDRGIWVLCRPNDYGELRFASLDFPNNSPAQAFHRHDLPLLTPNALNKDWTIYPLAMLKTLESISHKLKQGVDLLYGSNLPIANGLSSSHALMIVTALAICPYLGLDTSQETVRLKLAQLSQIAENKYVGVQSGLMDGFVISLGQKNKAILLSCHSVEYEHIDMRLDDAELWIIDSGNSRELSGSAYNQRVQECQEALAQINLTISSVSSSLEIINSPLQCLCELDYQSWLSVQPYIKDPILFKRAQHVISENQRVVLASKALRDGNMRLLGELFTQSHNSLRDDYAVTGSALDTLAKLCMEQSDCLGARMTGAGFGGCFIALFQAGSAQKCLTQIADMYHQQQGLALQAFPYKSQTASQLINS